MIYELWSRCSYSKPTRLEVSPNWGGPAWNNPHTHLSTGQVRLGSEVEAFIPSDFGRERDRARGFYLSYRRKLPFDVI